MKSWLYQFSFKSEAVWLLMSSVVMAVLGLLIYLLLSIWYIAFN